MLTTDTILTQATAEGGAGVRGPPRMCHALMAYQTTHERKQNQNTKQDY